MKSSDNQQYARLERKRYIVSVYETMGKSKGEIVELFSMKLFHKNRIQYKLYAGPNTVFVMAYSCLDAVKVYHSRPENVDFDEMIDCIYLVQNVLSCKMNQYSKILIHLWHHEKDNENFFKYTDKNQELKRLWLQQNLVPRSWTWREFLEKRTFKVAPL